MFLPEVHPVKRQGKSRLVRCLPNPARLDRVNRVTPGLFVSLELEQAALFRLEQEIVERLKTVSAFVEARPLPPHCLLHERAVNLVIFAALRAVGTLLDVR